MKREYFQETGCLIHNVRWALSWVGHGTANNKDWDLTDYAALVVDGDIITGKSEPMDQCPEFSSSDWYSAQELVRLLQSGALPNDRILERSAAAAT